MYPIVRNTSSQSDKPNRSSTSKPVHTQITPQLIEDGSPTASPNSGKQKSAQSDDSIKVSNVRPVRDKPNRSLNQDV